MHNKIIKRQFYIENGLYFDEKIKLSEDLELFLRCCHYMDKFYFVNNYEYYYVMYDGSTSLYSRDVDYFSLIDIQNKLKLFCLSQMSEDDIKHYDHYIGQLSRCVISETKVFEILSIPKKVQKLKEDGLWALTGYPEFMPWLIIKTLFHRIKINIAMSIYSTMNKFKCNYAEKLV